MPFRASAGCKPPRNGQMPVPPHEFVLPFLQVYSKKWLLKPIGIQVKKINETMSMKQHLIYIIFYAYSNPLLTHA
jgi:hypothetical protein